MSLQLAKMHLRHKRRPLKVCALLGTCVLATLSLVSLRSPAHAYDASAFAIRVKTDNPGSSSSTQFTIPIAGSGYNYNVDCDDDGVNDHTNATGSITCNYLASGEYTVAITGTFPQIYFNFGGDSHKLLEVRQWGNGLWRSMSYAFAGCENMHITATDAPNFSSLTNIQSMFQGASAMNEDINHWDTSKVTDMGAAFMNARAFNQPLDNWDVSNVTDMGWMFLGARAFNQPIEAWDTSKVTDMSLMFNNAAAFNQPLGGWDTSLVTNMSQMFSGASSFNENIGSWDTGRVTDMSNMLWNADSFNQPLEGWNTSNVTTMYSMFYGADSFNQPLGGWNTSKVTNMNQMFANAASFNQPLATWDTSSVVNMGSLFSSANSFNQPIGGWNTSNVTNMSQMFSTNSAFNQPINGWDTSKVTDMRSMFYGNSAFNQPIGSWNTSNVTNMSYMFHASAPTFHPDVRNWNVSKVTTMTSMFGGKTLPLELYDAILVGWASQTVVPGVNFDAGYSHYFLGADARAILTSAPNNWIISDSGYEYPAPTLTSPVSGDTLTTNTPTIRGTAVPGSEVQVTMGGQNFVATTGENGEWSVTVTTALSDGWYMISARAGTSSTVYVYNVTVAYPHPTIISPISSATLSTNTPTITGTAVPGSEVVVTIGGQTLTATANENGEWKVVVAVPLPDGTYTISVREGTSATAYVNGVHIAYPLPVITSPASGATLNTGTPTFTGTSVPGSKVEIAIGGQSIIATTASNGAFSVKAAPLADGWHKIRVRAETSNMVDAGYIRIYASQTLEVSGDLRRPTIAVVNSPTTLPGQGSWVQRTSGDSGFSDRGSHGVVSFNGKLWVIGGMTGSGRANDVWSSVDGTSWTQEVANAPWSARNGHQVIVYSGKIWVIGGTDGSYLNDVWSSVDGTNWTQVVANAAWSARASHEVVVHDDALWVIGGDTQTDGAASDVWRSEDGIDWTQVTASADWPIRHGFEAVSFDGKMWVMGGVINNWNAFSSDVWSSEDGATWTLATDAAPWQPRASHKVEVLDGAMLLIGGAADRWNGEYSDIWLSYNGRDWSLATPSPGWEARRGHASTVHEGSVYVVGGSVGSGWTRSSDVWASPKMSSPRYTFCWDTVIGGCANQSTGTSASFTLPSPLASGSWYFSVTSYPGSELRDGIKSSTTTPHVVKAESSELPGRVDAPEVASRNPSQPPTREQGDTTHPGAPGSVSESVDKTPILQVDGSQQIGQNLIIPNKPTFRGTAMPGAQVKVALTPSDAGCGALADENSRWQCTLQQELAEGRYIINTSITNPDGTTINLDPFTAEVLGAQTETKNGDPEAGVSESDRSGGSKVTWNKGAIIAGVLLALVILFAAMMRRKKSATS